MPLIDKATLISQLSPPLDTLLATQLVDEFISAERRFIQRDWEPVELDGGQFCEICARIYYHQDSGILNQAKDFNDCLKFVENDGLQHAISPRHDALHVSKVLRTVYKFRSQRGAVHISPRYSPNHMDAKFVIENVRWLMNETLRIFWSGDRETVARAVRELLDFDVPAVGRFGGSIVVQRTDLTAEEEILILMHYAGDAGFSRLELGRYAQCAPSTVTRALQKLESPSVREVIQIGRGQYRLTDLGSRESVTTSRRSLCSKLEHLCATAPHPPFEHLLPENGEKESTVRCRNDPSPSRAAPEPPLPRFARTRNQGSVRCSPSSASR